MGYVVVDILYRSLDWKEVITEVFFRQVEEALFDQSDLEKSTWIYEKEIVLI